MIPPIGWGVRAGSGVVGVVGLFVRGGWWMQSWQLKGSRADSFVWWITSDARIRSGDNRTPSFESTASSIGVFTVVGRRNHVCGETGVCDLRLPLTHRSGEPRGRVLHCVLVRHIDTPQVTQFLVGFWMDALHMPPSHRIEIETSGWPGSHSSWRRRSRCVDPTCSLWLLRGRSG